MGVFVFLISTVCLSEAVDDYGSYVNGGRIIGGADGDHGKFPFLVSIQRLHDGVWRQYCGGSIVSASTVLTACHCINQYVKLTQLAILDPKVLRVVAGVGDVSQKSIYRQDVLAKHLIPHPQCQNTPEAPFFGDSAVIILQTTLVFNAKVQPLKIFSNNPSIAALELQKRLNNEEKCLIAGWGKTVVDQKEYGPKLQVAKVMLMTAQQCQNIFCQIGVARYCHRDYSKLKQFCAVGTQNSSICFADSGGPLVCGGFVFGLISYGSASCPVDWPSMYTSVEVLLQMINSWGQPPIGSVLGGRRLKASRQSRSRYPQS